MEYYDKMEGPLFEPISIQNAILKQELSADVKTFLSEEWKKLNEKGQHQCPFVKDEIRCSQTFSNPSQMLKHYQNLHTSTTQFQCKVCNANFYERAAANDHVMVKHMCKS